jgi:hypothetical protein
MSFLPPPDDQNLPEPTPEQLAQLEAKVEELEGAARKVGLYRQTHLLVLEPTTTKDGDRTARLTIVANFTAGDVAWSPRVQNPEGHDVDRQFRSIQSELETDEFEQYRQALEERIEREGDEDA